MPQDIRRLAGPLVLLGTVLLLLVIYVVRIRSAPEPPAAPLSASVAAFSGEAFACEHTRGCLTPAIAGTKVYTDGEAATGPTGKADLQTDTVVFRLDHNSKLQLQAVTDAVTHVTLWLGRLFVSHDPAGHDQIYVEAGRLLIAAIDTRFSVVVDDATGTVDGALDRGVYIAVPPGGGRVIVHLGTLAQSLVGGEELYVPPGATALPAPQPITADEVTRWNAVSCDWQGIQTVLTPGALPTPNGCGAAPPDTPVPPPATAVPVTEVVPVTQVVPVTEVVPVTQVVIVPVPVTVLIPQPVTVTPVPPGPSDTPTDTPTNTPTDTPTDTPTHTPTPPPPVITVTLPPQVTYTPPTNTPTNTPTPTWTPTFTPTWTPTNTPTRTAPPIITTSPPIGDTAPYRGTWLITDQSASRLTKLWINPDGSLVAVHWFSDCGAKICDLDATVARLEADGLKINAPVYGTVLLTMPDANTLKMEAHGDVVIFRRTTISDYYGYWDKVDAHATGPSSFHVGSIPYQSEPLVSVVIESNELVLMLVDAAHRFLAILNANGEYTYYISSPG